MGNFWKPNTGINEIEDLLSTNSARQMQTISNSGPVGKASLDGKV